MPADAPRIDVGPELATALVGRQFPQWAHLPVRPVCPGGWDNATFRLGPSLLLRLPRAVRYASQVGKEQRWLPWLGERLPLPVPEPLGIGAPDRGYPFAWSVFRWIDGTPLAAAGPVDDMRLADDLASFLAALQELATAAAPVAGSHSFDRGGDLAVYDAEARAALAALGGRSDGIDMAAAVAVWERALADRWTRSPVWVHGDVAAGNLLLRRGRLHAVIDFGYCAVGDPACDLAAAWTLFEGPARARFRAALPHDDATWHRAAGWTLWKAAITLAAASAPDPAPDPAPARRALAAVLAQTE
ncbi:MAG: aminoglycoside phosphotransferase family protein [Alphaproteobacteria bacterium]